MSALGRIFLFLTEWWVVIPICIGAAVTFLLTYLQKQNEFLKQWDPTLKILTWAIAAAIAWGLIPKREPVDEDKKGGSVHNNASIQNKWVPPDVDLFLRSCPGVVCDRVAILERKSKLDILGERKIYIESNGANTPWVKVRHANGRKCAELNSTQDGVCVSWEYGKQDIGWVNEQKLWSTEP